MVVAVAEGEGEEDRNRNVCRPCVVVVRCPGARLGLGPGAVLASTTPHGDDDPRGIRSMNEEGI